MHECCGADKKGCGCCDSSLATVGRVIFAVPFLVFGLGHFMAGQTMTGILAGWPFPLFLVYLSGAGMFLGGLALIINRYARLAAKLLALEVGLFVVGIHIPGFFAEGADPSMLLMYLLKDITLIGGALVLAAQLKNRGFSSK